MSVFVVTTTHTAVSTTALLLTSRQALLSWVAIHKGDRKKRVETDIDARVLLVAEQLSISFFAHRFRLPFHSPLSLNTFTHHILSLVTFAPSC